MFVSANAVQGFFAARPEGACWPEGLEAGSTGAGTTAALRAAGVPAGAVRAPAPGHTQDSESLWLQLQGLSWQGQRVRIVRGETGRDWLAERLSEAGARVDFVEAYRRIVPTLEEAARVLIAHAQEQPLHHVWLFSSSQAIDHLRSLAPELPQPQAQALCTHERIAQTARQAGFGRVGLVHLEGLEPAPSPSEALRSALTSAVTRAVACLQSVNR